MLELIRRAASVPGAATGPTRPGSRASEPPGSRPRDRTVGGKASPEWLWLAGALLAFTLAALPMQHYFIDDSYISFRYARNLVEGQGLVFNPGERVEGYTNFLWVIGVAAGIAIGATAEQSSLLLGVVAAAVAIVFTGRIARLLVPGPWHHVAPFLLATSTPLVFWTFSGMETVAVAALLAAGAWGILRSAEGPGFVAGGILALALCCLVRPDAVIFLAVSLAALPFLTPKRRIFHLALGAAVAAAILVPYASWKWWYYGALLPNTFHTKVGSGIAQIARGLRHTGTFLIFATAAGLLPGALLALRRADPRILYLWALVAHHVAYVVLVGDDSFLFFRFQVPLLPLYCALATSGFAALRDDLRATPVSFSKRVPALALACFMLAGAGWGHQGHYRETIADKAALNERFRTIARWLRTHADPADRIAVVAAGIIPYESGLPTLDMLGLTDARIARRHVESMGAGMAGHEKGDGRYVLDQGPRFILIHPITADAPFSKEHFARSSRRYVSTRELWALPAFHERYELRSTDLGGFTFNYFERRAAG